VDLVSVGVGLRARELVMLLEERLIPGPGDDVDVAGLDLRRERLCFVIAQRISTVRNADQIIVLDNGKIAAMGNHESLMAESPLYADIYYSQLKPETAG
ncbi:hypothetical protein LCGC14_2700180, partial [marine sediment metagenome]